MRFIKYIFTPNHLKYEGVRPINIYLLRVLYFLMFIGVGLETWSNIINHQGAWDHTRAVAFCVWAAYPTLSIFGLLKPLRWLPIVLFMIFYKTLWLIVVAYPLWQANALTGSPADEMAHVFLGAPFIALIVPWVYVFKTYVWGSKAKMV
ncbi:MAG TPA: hypothetical protein VGO50_15715 [Pyrinomonadaceae bacterium]|jgi:hypothetical protein|nr:hypothetical protein [Pyrinomonadaceae bacterium]